MPTLLSVNNYYYRRGGAEVVFLGQNRLFEDIGWRVIPFSMQHSSNFDTPWSEYFVNEIEFGAQYSTWQKLAWIPKVIYSFEARRKLARLVDMVQPDVCHAHNIYHHLSPAILSLVKSRGVPVVLTLHDLKLACPAYKMLTHDGICERCKGGRLYNVMWHRCIKESISLSAVVMLESILHRLLCSYSKNVDRFAVPSRFLIEKMVEWGWDRSRFTHIPNFVNVNTLRPNYEVGRPFLYFGRLGPEKGVATLIRAAASVKAPLQIAGAGPEEPTLRRLAADLGADVSFLGYLTGSVLYDAIRSARAVVLPSEWYENAPVSLMEAYALGKPVIGAHIGGIPELVRQGETGITFQSGSAESLATALRTFADMSAGRLAKMGRCGRVWMKAEYTAQRYCVRVLALYQELGVSF